jgi:hypothetical protein
MRWLLAWILVATSASAEPLEPPTDAPDGVDYTVEPADSLAGADVELGMAATGRAGSAPTRSRRVRFSGDEMSGALREGSGDPLAGGAVEGHGARGAVTVGRLAPRWGRGLVLGAAGDPWQREPLDRGARAAYRGRAGDGVWLRPGRQERFEALYGRFGRRPLAGARVRLGGVALGGITDGRGRGQSSLALARGAGGTEVACDRHGRWRVEAVLDRPLGLPRPEIASAPDSASARVTPSTGGIAPTPDSASAHATPSTGGMAPGIEDGPPRGAHDGWKAGLRVRAGGGGFASLAETGRAGPPQALAVVLSGPAPGVRMSVLGALWRFRPGVTGARASLAVERPLAHHGSLALGVEEQRGARRDPGPSGPLAPSGARPAGLRQGVWGEWWSGEGAVALGLRHESWGERPWVREVVRSVTSARVEARGPAGFQLAITHSLYRVKRGESLYLPEVESDRLVLRALSGEGERTRIEARTPLGGGRMRAGLRLASTTESRARAQWTLDWTRRARIRKSAETPAR